MQSKIISNLNLLKQNINLVQKLNFQMTEIKMGQKLEKLQVGDFVRTVSCYTKEDVFAFSEVNGDKSPIHLDAEYAATTIFKKPIVYGMQTGSVFSNLIGNTFKGAIYLNQSFAFKAPVFYDEEVENIVQIIDIDKKKRKITLKTAVRKIEEDKLAVVGEALIYYRELKQLEILKD